MGIITPSVSVGSFVNYLSNNDVAIKQLTVNGTVTNNNTALVSSLLFQDTGPTLQIGTAQYGLSSYSSNLYLYANSGGNFNFMIGPEGGPYTQEVSISAIGTVSTGEQGINIQGRSRMVDVGQWLVLGESMGTNGGNALQIMGNNGGIHTGTTTTAGAFTIKNTLDDGSGNMTVAGDMTVVGSLTVDTVTSLNSTIFLQSQVAGINNTQIISGNPTVAGVTGELLSIAQQGISWVFALDASGNLGLDNTLYASANVHAGLLMHVAGTQTNDSSFGQGAYFGWNYEAGTGETDFMNNKGGGGGGFNFYNGTGSTWSLIGQMYGDGTLATQGTINTIAGTYLGTIYWTMERTGLYKRVFIWIAGYQNNTATAQNFTIPVGFSDFAIYQNYIPFALSLSNTVATLNNVAGLGTGLVMGGGLNTITFSGATSQSSTYNGACILQGI